MNSELAEDNERILAQVEGWGGGYVWEPELFAVTLIDVPISDVEAVSLSRLTGVQQIALNASQLSLPTLQMITAIPGLRSLVLSKILLSQEQLLLLESCGPRVEVVNNEA